MFTAEERDRVRERFGDDFAAHLRAKGNTPEHVAQTVTRVRALFDGCGFKTTADADAVRNVRRESWSLGADILNDCGN